MCRQIYGISFLFLVFFNAYFYAYPGKHENDAYVEFQDLIQIIFKKTTTFFWRLKVIFFAFEKFQ